MRLPCSRCGSGDAGPVLDMIFFLPPPEYGCAASLELPLPASPPTIGSAKRQTKRGWPYRSQDFADMDTFG